MDRDSCSQTHNLLSYLYSTSVGQGCKPTTFQPKKKKNRLALISHRCCTSASDPTNFFPVGQSYLFLMEPEDREKLAENYGSQETPGRRRAQVPVWALAKEWRPGAAKNITWSQTVSSSGVPQVLIHWPILLPLSQFLACSSESLQAPTGLVLNGHGGVYLTAKIVPVYTLASE